MLCVLIVYFPIFSGQISENSRHVLLEVTSSTSLVDAKKAMDSLILAMLEADFASSQSEVSFI